MLPTGVGMAAAAEAAQCTELAAAAEAVACTGLAEAALGVAQDAEAAAAAAAVAAYGSDLFGSASLESRRGRRIIQGLADLGAGRRL